MKPERLILLFLLLICTSKVHTQYWDPDKSSRFFVGGTGGLSIGSYTNIELTPMGGLNITPRLSTGVSAIYQYLGINNYRTNFFGGRLSSEFVVFKELYEILPFALFDNVYLHAEYEYLNTDADLFNYLSYTGTAQISPDASRIQFNSGLFGIGFGMPLGIKTSMKISVLVNHSNRSYYPYNAPIIRLELHSYLRSAVSKKYYDFME